MRGKVVFNYYFEMIFGRPRTIFDIFAVHAEDDNSTFYRWSVASRRVLDSPVCK